MCWQTQHMMFPQPGRRQTNHLYRRRLPSGPEARPINVSLVRKSPKRVVLRRKGGRSAGIMVPRLVGQAPPFCGVCDCRIGGTQNLGGVRTFLKSPRH